MEVRLHVHGAEFGIGSYVRQTRCLCGDFVESAAVLRGEGLESV
jgi:hypothetical protein